MSGSSLLAWVYANSIISAVSVEFPEYSWHPWLFTRASNGWITSISTGLRNGDVIAETVVRELIEHMAGQLNVNRLGDWYRPSLAQIESKFAHAVNTLGGLSTLLSQLYPHHKWNHSLFALRTRATQRRLLFETMEAFPNEGTTAAA